MNNKQALLTIRNKLHQTMHMLILMFFVWVVFVYFKAPQILIELHHFLSSIIGALSFIFPYIQWLTGGSQTPELTHAFVEMVYLCFVMLFLNLFIAVFPAFYGSPKRNYLLSGKGFSDFLEENIYCKLSPSVSLVAPGERLWGRSSRGRQLIEADSFKQIIIVYIKKYATTYYGGLALAGFIFFPLVAYNKINSTSLEFPPFWLVVIVFSYTQVRWVFELSVLLLSLLTNSKSKGV